MTAAAALELDGVELRFGAVHALAGVTLRVRAGERVALIGPSGAGKSSLLSLLNGTAAPTAGRVRVLGSELARLRERDLRRVRASVATIHQGLALVGPLRVVHNVNAGRLGHWGFWRAAASLLFPRDGGEVSAALERVGLAARRDERTDRLSGGEQQRVAIARALVQRPAILLADEPVASLDPPRARAVMDLLLEATDAVDATLLVSLHDVGVALGRFERVIGLRAGRVAFDAEPAAVTERMLRTLYAGKAATA